jgi:hypothetical protein
MWFRAAKTEAFYAQYLKLQEEMCTFSVENWTREFKVGATSSRTQHLD